MRDDAPPTRRVAVMQPYFLPYAGYFRLFAAVDDFVLFDCVQFPRRGRVHRTEVATNDGGAGWLTLPLANQPRDIPIHALEFAPGARTEFDRRMAQWPWIASSRGPAADVVRTLLSQPLEGVTDFLASTLAGVAGLLGFAPRIVRSSSLAIDPSLRGQSRVIAIAQAMHATHYLNSPGGRALYEPQAFAQAGIALEFLEPYAGPYSPLLRPLLQVDPDAIRADVLAGLHDGTPRA